MTEDDVVKRLYDVLFDKLKVPKRIIKHVESLEAVRCEQPVQTGRSTQLLTDGVLQLRNTVVEGIVGGTWAISIMVNRQPQHLHVSIEEIFYTPSCRFVDLIDAVARLLYRDPLADYAYVQALDNIVLARIWIAKRFTCAMQSGQPRFEPRRDLRLQSNMFFDGFQTGRSNTLCRMEEKFGRELYAPWQTADGREAMEAMGNIDIGSLLLRQKFAFQSDGDAVIVTKRLSHDSRRYPMTDLGDEEWSPELAVLFSVHGRKLVERLLK